MSFKDKVVLVTGGSSGIGAATAVLFAKEGANVAIAARNENKMKIVAENCAKVGNKPLLIKADVAKDDDVEKMIKQTIDKFGKLDVLVNNAGILKTVSILDGKLTEVYDEIMNVNLRAVVNITKLAAPYLLKTKGNIVNISSVAATILPDVKYGCYCVSKAGLSHFTRAAALELAPHGVRVNSVSPGPVKTDILQNAGMDATWDDMTPMTALNRVSDSEEIANLVLFLASDKAKGVTGSDYVSDNGIVLKK